MVVAAEMASDKIKVAIRVRPLMPREKSLGSCWKVQENTIAQLNSSGKIVPSAVYTFGKKLEY